MLELGVVVMEGEFVGVQSHVFLFEDAEGNLLFEVLQGACVGKGEGGAVGEFREGASDDFSMRMLKVDEGVVQRDILRHRNGIYK